jgi:hypothetical protein
MEKNNNSEELYFKQLVTSAVTTLVSISQNGINPIALNKQIDNHFNQHIVNASISLSSFSFDKVILIKFKRTNRGTESSG